MQHTPWLYRVRAPVVAIVNTDPPDTLPKIFFTTQEPNQLAEIPTFLHLYAHRTVVPCQAHASRQGPRLRLHEMQATMSVGMLRRKLHSGHPKSTRRPGGHSQA